MTSLTFSFSAAVSVEFMYYKGRRKVKNPVSTVHPSSVSWQRKVYWLVSLLGYFRIFNFPCSPLFCPENLNQDQARSGEKVSPRSDRTCICSPGSSSTHSRCAASIWIKLRCRRITSGTTTESHSR